MTDDERMLLVLIGRAVWLTAKRERQLFDIRLKLMRSVR